MINYNQSINELKEIFRQAFTESKGTDKLRVVCCQYFKQGKKYGITTGELVDFLGISSPSILDEAQYSDSEAQEVMNIISLITDEEIESTII